MNICYVYLKITKEAGELMRENLKLFADTVKNTLRGKTVGGEAFPKFI